MKRLFGLVFLIVAFNASAIEINSKLSGSWYNPSQDGHGLNVAVYNDELTLIYWYVYHTDGTPMFLITVGTNDGNQTSGTTYYNTGMRFGSFDPNDRMESEWGTSTLTFTDCNNATLQYWANDPAYGSGTIPMQRLASVSGLKCSDSPLHGNYIGIWSEPNGDIAGVGIAALFENGNIAFGAAGGADAGTGLGQWWATGSNTAQFQVTRYDVNGGTRVVSGNATFNEDGLTATYTGGGRLTAFPIPSFQKSMSVGELAGTYDIQDWDESVIGSATIDSNGNVTGSTFNGCQLTGVVFVPNTNFNQIGLDSNVSNCGNTTRIYGAAVDIQNVIHVAATDESYGYIWKLKPK